MTLKMLAPWKKSYDQPRQNIKKQRHCFTDKGLYNQSYGFSSSHVQMWELDRKEGWVSKNWCFWTVVLEKTLKSPLNSKDIKPVNPKGNHIWIIIRRTDTEAEAPILWPPDGKSWLIGKDPDVGKIEGRRRKGQQRRSLTQWTWVWVNSRSRCRTGRPCVLWFMGHKESDTTEQLNWTELIPWYRGITLEGYWVISRFFLLWIHLL